MKDKARLAALIARAEVHASLLESVASVLEADGVGLDPEEGHVRHLRHMAGALRSQAALGRVSERYSTQKYLDDGSGARRQGPIH